MNSLPQNKPRFNSFSKSASIWITPVNRLAAYLEAGGSFRCPGCLERHNKRTLGLVANYKKKIPFAVCRECKKSSRVDDQAMQAFIERMAAAVAL